MQKADSCASESQRRRSSSSVVHSGYSVTKRHSVTKGMDDAVKKDRLPLGESRKELQQVDRQSSSAIQNEEGVRRKGKHWRDHPLVRRLASWLESRPVATVMSLLTFYALFGDDIRLAGASRAQDEAFFDLSFVCLVMFATEILLNSIVRRDYFLRFYFWLDLIATVSLFSDVGWLWNPIMGSSNELQVHSNQVSHVARTGSRAGRVVRVVRMVRLFRIGKLYRYLMEHPALPQRLRRPSRTSTMVSDFPDTDMNARFKERSQVGRVLSDRTTRRVILLILLLLIGFPLFDTATYREPPSRRDLALHAVHALSFDPSSRLFNETLNAFVAADDSLLHLRLPGMDEDAVITLLRSMPSFRGGTYLAHFTAVQRIYRATEVVLAEATGCYLTSGALGTLSAEQCQTVAVWSVRDFERLSAALNIGQTLFIIVMLGIGAMLFMADATQLVIQPLANLVSMVYTLARNPLEALVDSTAKAGSKKGHETYLLKSALERIAGLLQVGLGEAGAQIIAQRIHKSTSVNVMLNGARMYGVFGFCDIRQFTDATECLQEEVMVFVNRIGNIVHTAAHRYAGAPNKNVGDAFLLVWRMTAEDRRAALETGVAASEAESESVLDSLLADNALFAFLRIMVDIEKSNKDGSLREYASNPKIMERFPGGFKVKMGFGLHYGWAIEGAIGSQFKIDASYLSPDVNMAAQLEGATKHYQVPLLLSGALVGRLSDKAQEYCRRIDRVTVKGHESHMDLHTFDVLFFPDTIGVDDDHADADFEEDSSVALLQLGMHPDFRQRFQTGLDAYITGDWEAARRHLQRVLEVAPKDGPTAALMGFMRDHEFTAPRSWAGHRELVDK